MSVTAAPPPIPGDRIDPPPKPMDATIRMVDDHSRAAGIGLRAVLRFTGARATLLTAGTTYYVFLAFFALVAVAFGVAALIGSEQITQWVTEAVETAFPGVVGAGKSLDPQQLRTIGSTTSIIGLLVLLYSGTGAMTAVSNSIHLIYGAPPDPRNIAWAKARLVVWMLIIAPLSLLSFAPSLLVTGVAGPILDWMGIESSAGQAVVIVLSQVLALALDFWIIYMLLGHLGGIRPHRRARLIGTAVGAVAVEVLKYASAAVFTWAVSKPQYGAFAVPIAALFVLYLLSMTLYGSAALAAGIAEKDEPLADQPPEPPEPPEPPVSSRGEPSADES